MANRRSVMRTLVAGAASIGAPRLFAQDDKSTVTVLVGAATTMDATARLISEHLREALGRHAYGCDVCQEVCPWNARPADPDAAGSPWLPRAVFDGRSIATLWRTPDDELRRALKGSAMMRAGVTRLRRNIAVCAWATGDAEALTALREVDEPTCDDPIVAEHIHWALTHEEP